MFKYLIAIALIFSSFTAGAQESSTEDTNASQGTTSAETTNQVGSAKSDVEKIEVTGSLIRRIDMEGPSQIIIIDREQIENSGFNEVGSLLRSSTVSPFGSSADRANLKGLGSARTLVLVNGQRLPAGGDSYSSGTDINVIPLAGVERIEILKEGASSTYGSDALAGVVNIITRENIDEIIFASKLSVPSQPGGGSLRTSIAYGDTWGKSSIMTSFQIIASDTFKASNRNYLEGINKDSRFSNNYIDLTADANTTFPFPSCTELNADGLCEEELASESVSEPGLDFSSFTSYKYKMSSELEFFSDLLLRYGRSNSRNFEAVFTGERFTGADAPPANWGTALPNYTAGNDIQVFYRFKDLPKRKTQFDQLSAGYVFGFKGLWGDSDWEWKASNNTHYFLTDEKNSNYGLRAPMRAAIINDTYNPFDNTKRDTTGFLTDPFSRAYYIINSAQATANGELGEYLGAVWSAGFGTFFQFSEYKDERDDETLNGEILGLGGVTGGGNRFVGALFGELSGLFGNSVELQLSLRHDQYNDFGGTTNPRIASRWKINNTFMVRGSAGTGFQAPTLQDSYGPKLTGFLFVRDYLLCNADPNSPGCNNQFYPAEQGANPDLKEETSFAYSIGTVIQPMRGFSMSFDYWRTKVEDVVSSDAQGLLEAEAAGADPAKYGAVVERNGPGNSISFISAPLRNFAKDDVDGLDINLTYDHKVSFGNLRYSIDHTVMFHAFSESYEELGKRDLLGEDGFPYWKNVVTINWQSKDNVWGSALTARTISVVEKFDPNKGLTPVYTEADFQINYKSPYGKFQLGFLNLLDTQPEFDDDLQTKFDSSLYSRLRTSYLQYETTF